ncbi:Uma2 family endonuclease [Synechocystis sp. LKSZ1]|uniref:Uma2 family endonuclease n=1 Tax=Synechocystis sp. LKSZ1 TaxID=3144951 RepID=UPI00336BB96E
MPPKAFKEYWVADLSHCQVFIFDHPVNGQYARVQVSSDGVISPPAFPNLELSLKDLFRW